jgi:hypothetical protein
LAVRLLLVVAAVAGDTVNYQIGNYLGPKVRAASGRGCSTKHLIRTTRSSRSTAARRSSRGSADRPHVCALRTAWSNDLPAVPRHNVAGGGLGHWFLFAGYWFGNIPWVKERR